MFPGFTRDMPQVDRFPLPRVPDPPYPRGAPANHCAAQGGGADHRRRDTATRRFSTGPRYEDINERPRGERREPVPPQYQHGTHPSQPAQCHSRSGTRKDSHSRPHQAHPHPVHFSTFRPPFMAAGVHGYPPRYHGEHIHGEQPEDDPSESETELHSSRDSTVPIWDDGPQTIEQKHPTTGEHEVMRGKWRVHLPPFSFDQDGRPLFNDEPVLLLSSNDVKSFYCYRLNQPRLHSRDIGAPAWIKKRKFHRFYFSQMGIWFDCYPVSDKIPPSIRDWEQLGGLSEKRLLLRYLVERKRWFFCYRVSDQELPKAKAWRQKRGSSNHDGLLLEFREMQGTFLCCSVDDEGRESNKPR